jgi:hypothetical protein
LHKACVTKIVISINLVIFNIAFYMQEFALIVLSLLRL